MGQRGATSAGEASAALSSGPNVPDPDLAHEARRIADESEPWALAMIAADLEAMPALPAVLRGLPLLEAARRVRDATLWGEDLFAHPPPAAAVPGDARRVEQAARVPLSDRDVEAIAIGAALTHDLPLDVVRARVRDALARGDRRLEVP